MKYRAINIDQKFSMFSESWTPRIVAEFNDYQLKLVKLDGEFVWHKHDDTDEVFIVVEGELRIDFRDGSVKIASGEMFVVPKGVEHMPIAIAEVRAMIIEPRGVVNTGDALDTVKTAKNDVWI